jgi:hypothetical protein
LPPPVTKPLTSIHSRIVYAWENPGVPVDEVLNDILRVFHHPGARDERIEIQRAMFDTVRNWANETPLRSQLDHLLSSESVRNHKNHILSSEAMAAGARSISSGNGCIHGDGGHGKPTGSLWEHVRTLRQEAGVRSPTSAAPPTSSQTYQPPPTSAS